MTFESLWIQGVIGRKPDAETQLAAFGLMFSLSVLIETPVIMLLATSNALSRDRQSFRTLWRFMMAVNIVITTIAILMAFTPLLDLYLGALLNVPGHIIEATRQKEPDQCPGGEDGEDGQDQALEAAGQPGGVTFLAALGRLPAEGVDVAADEEEDWHDLEEPGEPFGPGDDGNHVLDLHMVALGMDGDDEPVAEDNEADGGGAQEVEVAVAVGWCLGGLVGGLGPDGEGHFGRFWLDAAATGNIFF